MPTRAGRPFTLSRFLQHEKECASHLQAVALLVEVERIKAVAASGDTTLSKGDLALAKQRRMKSSVMHAYFRPTISHKRAATANTASILAVEDEPAGAPPIFINTCEGGLRKYRRDNALNPIVLP